MEFSRQTKTLPLPQKLGTFSSIADALDYAAYTEYGYTFFNARGNLEMELSYAALRQRAIELARRYLGAGLKRHSHVGIIAEMHPDFITAFFACQYAGLIAVPLPTPNILGGRMGWETQLARILESASIEMVVRPTSLAENFENIHHSLDAERILSVDELLGKPAADEMLLAPLRPDEISHIQYSSGSTRFPLGIKISQKAFFANSQCIANALGFTPEDRVISWLPYYHDMGLIGCLLVPVSNQIPVDFLLTDSFARQPLQWLKLIAGRKGTISFSPSFGYEICSRLAKNKRNLDLDLSHWRVAGIGGDMIKSFALNEFSKVYKPYGFSEKAFVPSYGLAESTLAFSFQPLGEGITVDLIDKNKLHEDLRAEKLTQVNGREFMRVASCGYPLPQHRVEIRNEKGVALSECEVGRIFIQGPSLMDGYYTPSRSQSNGNGNLALKEGWLDTGDMGYLSGGRLYITGRQKEMILIKGRNIWPQDLEWHVEREVEGLRPRDTAAFPHENKDGEEIAVILVQCRTSNPQERAMIEKQVQAVLYRNVGITCQVELIPPRSLPFTTSGKLMRSQARQLWLQGVIKNGTKAG